MQINILRWKQNQDLENLIIFLIDYNQVLVFGKRARCKFLFKGKISTK